MSEGHVLKLRLSLMGRPVRSYTFDKPVVTVGRDPSSDIHVDNPGVSRDHFRFEAIEDGTYQVVDLGSANGTFVNEQMVNTTALNNNDVIRFGKYTLWVGYEKDRRTVTDGQRSESGEGEQNTVVLSRGELDKLMDVARERDQDPPAPPSVILRSPVAGAAPVPMRPRPAGPNPVLLAGVFAAGVAIGAVTVWLLLGH